MLYKIYEYNFIAISDNQYKGKHAVQHAGNIPELITVSKHETQWRFC